MKKLVLSLTLIAGLSTAVLAQTPVKFGLKAGVTFSNMTLSTMGVSASFDSKTSFYVGGTADIPVSNIFSVQPGLTLVNKGTKVNGGDFNFDGSTVNSDASGTINAMYIEVPVNLLANFAAGSGKVFFGAGPYYAFAVDAYAKSGGIKQDIEIGSDEDNFKRSEFGLNFLAGYQLNRVNIHAGYGLGLSSVIPDQEGLDMKFKNKVFSVGLGFTF
ncbi:porin family protein [Pedobacter boryungensis]|uniref:PorT family protein n=1 Tax=Pedobacter boryungensis TaxID=869962 RepID=A0ABX2DAC8_9SPHI|nr:porin family protein [Pedobacter boryungensis]NQX30276.1 PorT family protein [Pedobacter boryungensis]